jgi:Transmembrane domain of unknown function (DUF3566)
MTDRRDDNRPLAPPRSLSAGPHPQEERPQTGSTSNPHLDQAPTGNQHPTPPPPPMPGADPRPSAQQSTGQASATPPPPGAVSTEVPRRTDIEEQDDDTDEITSPIAMAAAAVAAARDRFTRNRDNTRDTTKVAPPLARPPIPTRQEPTPAHAAGIHAAGGHAAGAATTARRTSPWPGGPSRPTGTERVTAPAAPPSTTRRARLRLVRVDPWSVMKTAFLLSIAFGIMCVVAVFVIWSVLSAANVFGSINTSVEQVIETEFRIEEYVGMERVLPFTMLIAVVDVVLLTAIATLAAFLYNLAASLLGGLELTLAEDQH